MNRKKDKEKVGLTENTVAIISLITLIIICMFVNASLANKLQKFSNTNKQLATQLFLSQVNVSNLSRQNSQLQSENTNLSEMLGQLNQTMFKFRLQLGFIDTAQQVASEHEWVYHQYMCGDFSNDLVSALRDQGWSAKRVLGYHYENGDGTCSQSNFDRFECKHYWVIIQVPIEATIGEIIDPQIYAREYVK